MLSLAVLLNLLVTDTPVLGCQTSAAVCTQSAVLDQDDRAALTRQCEVSHGKLVPRCDQQSGDGRCVAGDTTVVFHFPEARGDALTGSVAGAAKTCHATGGTFFLGKDKRTKAPPAKSTRFPLGPLKLQTEAAADCQVEAGLASATLTCGTESRPTVSLTIGEYAPEDSLGLNPNGPGDVLDALKEAAAPSTVVAEVGKSRADVKAGTWRVDYIVTPAHGLPSHGFAEAKKVGGRGVLCTARGWSKVDVAELSKACAKAK